MTEVSTETPPESTALTTALGSEAPSFLDSPIYRKVTQLEVFGHRHLLHTEEMANRIGPQTVGISLMRQAPLLSSDIVAGIEVMLRRVPSVRRGPIPQIGVGDQAPDFVLRGTGGAQVSSTALRGRTYAMRLTRSGGSGIICPACMPGLDDLTRTVTRFADIGVELIVVLPISSAQVDDVMENLSLPYALYSDEDWHLYKAFETGFAAGPPLPAWVIVDDQGVVQFVWRARHNSPALGYVEADEVLRLLEPIVGQ